MRNRRAAGSIETYIAGREESARNNLGVGLAVLNTIDPLLLGYGSNVDLLNPVDLFIIILVLVLRSLWREVVARVRFTHQWSKGLHVCSSRMH